MSWGRKCRIRVVLADDSRLTRKVLRSALERDPEICVVGEASDGVEAVDLVLKLRPDVVVMDVVMPRKDGIEATKEIMDKLPTPILVFSSITQEGSKAALEALEAGALEVMPKPDGSPLVFELGELERELIKKVKILALVGRAKLKLKGGVPRAPSATVPKPLSGGRPEAVVAVAASTGGPKALTEVVPGLDATLPVAVLIVQHMPPGFTKSLADRLDKISRFKFKEAEEGDVVVAGCGYVAPGDYHMLVRIRRGRPVIELDRGPKIHGVRPAADPTLKCVAEVWGPYSVAVVLTGMGCDGAEGALEIRRRGGYVVVQDEATSVVWSMPKSVIDLGAANAVLPLERIPHEVNRVLRSMLKSKLGGA